MQIGGGNRTAAVINVTPMIDILLVLLIVLMLLLPNHTVGLKSDIPQPAPDNSTVVPDPLNLVLRIQKDHTMQINSQPVLSAELGDRLRALFAVRPDGVLFVDGDRELEFAEIAAAIDTAHGAGVNRIGVLTSKSTSDISGAR